MYNKCSYERGKFMEIKYDKIITVDQYKKLGRENFDKLAELGARERKIIEYAYPNINDFLRSKKAKEVAFLSRKNKDLSTIEKMALVSNIIYPDEQSFCKYLNKVFSLDELKGMSEILKKYKQLESIYTRLGHKPDFDIDLFKPLYERAQTVYGYTDFEVYFNRINGLITFKEELLNPQKTFHL